MITALEEVKNGKLGWHNFVQVSPGFFEITGGEPKFIGGKVHSIFLSVLLNCMFFDRQD